MPRKAPLHLAEGLSSLNNHTYNLPYIIMGKLASDVCTIRNTHISAIFSTVHKGGREGARSTFYPGVYMYNPQYSITLLDI